MNGTVLLAIPAAAALLASVVVKYVSTMRLWANYKPEQYWSHGDARRLFLAGKITPVLAAGSLVILSACTRLVWLEVPALLFFAVIAIGVARIVRNAYLAAR